MTSTLTAEVLEIHLEAAGQHLSAIERLLLSGSGYGSAQFRFVARPPGPDRGSADHMLGAIFPIIEGVRDLSNHKDPNGWIRLAAKRLEELDRRLLHDGWVRQPGTGRHWWSRKYLRTEP